ncbi:MAG: hypothetical protein ACLPR9_05425 [Acidimicrobiales bacterium]
MALATDSFLSGDGLALELLRGGASRIAYLLDTRLPDLDAVLDALNEVCAGQTVLDPGIVDSLVQRRGDPASTGVGQSYLEVCGAAPGDHSTDQVAAGIRAALEGDLLVPMKVHVPCHSADTSRWFDVFISSRLADDGHCLGATVTLALSCRTTR